MALDQKATEPGVNPEVEQLVIGALLYDASLIDQVAARGGKTLFADPVHSEIYSEIERRVKLGQGVGASLMAQWARAMPGLEHLGGPQYLLEMQMVAPPAMALPDFIASLSEGRSRREIYAALTEARSALEQNADAAGVAGRLEASLALMEHGGGPSPVTLGEALSVAAERFAQVNSGEAPAGVQTGIGALDSILGGMWPGELILLGGRPSMGKTSVALSVALNAARAGAKVAIFSLEMDPDQLAIRAWSEATSQQKQAIKFSSIRRGEVADGELEALMRAGESIMDLPIAILPREFGDTSALYSAAKQAKRRLGGLDLLIVDYAQLIRSQARSRYEQITEISQALKLMAGQLHVPMLALSQLSRALESRDDKRPMLSDLRESGQLEQDADAVLFCYRDEYYLEREKPEGGDDLVDWDAAMRHARNRMEIIVAKQRQGAIGTAHVFCNPALNRIWEA